MKTRLLPLFAFVLLSSGLRAEGEAYRTWTDTQGRKLEATFRGIENGNVFLQVRNGYVYRLSLDKLSAPDQQAAKTLKPEGLGIPSDPNLAQAAAQAFTAAGPGLVAEIWPRARQGLDEYAEAWQRTHRATCEAHRPDGATGSPTAETSICLV